jgi:hypothetical protein
LGFQRTSRPGAERCPSQTARRSLAKSSFVVWDDDFGHVPLSITASRRRGHCLSAGSLQAQGHCMPQGSACAGVYMRKRSRHAQGSLHAQRSDRRRCLARSEMDLNALAFLSNCISCMRGRLILKRISVCMFVSVTGCRYFFTDS